MALKIIFAGTPEIALPCLQALMDSPHEVIAVYTQPDRPAGRGREIMPSSVKVLACARHIPVYQPQTLRDLESQQSLRALSADVMVVMAYGLLLPPAVLMMPRFGCINVHVSLLPRWRGAAPIQHSVLAGDAETGVTIMQMDEGLDTGAILAQTHCNIEARDTSEDLQQRLAPMGAALLLKTLENIEKNHIKPQPQDNRYATYATKIQKKDAELNWRLSAEMLDRAVRAYCPTPIAFTFWKQQPLRIWRAHVLVETHAVKPGTVLRVSEAGIDVATGDNVLRLLQLQMPGKKPQRAADFIHAYHQQLLPLQTVFGLC